MQKQQHKNSEQETAGINKATSARLLLNTVDKNTIVV